MISDNLKEESVYNISHNWFLYNDNDFTKFLNISIGQIIQLYTFELLFNKAHPISSNITIKNIIKRLELHWQARFFYSYFFFKK